MALECAQKRVPYAMIKRATNVVAALTGISFMGAFASVTAEPTAEPSFQPLIEDLPLSGKIIVRNSSSSETSIYYNYDERYGDLQMFFVRFRDRNGQLVEIDGTLEGWFTPKIYSSDVYWERSVPRRVLRIPANGAVEFERRLTDIARQVRGGRPAVEGPCEVQVRLSGYLNNDSNRTVEATTDWNAGPCPR